MVHYLGTVVSFAPSNSLFHFVELGWSYLAAVQFTLLQDFGKFLFLLFSLTVNQ